MAWVAITNKTGWEYDNAPPDPGGAQSALWAKQTAGIRTTQRSTFVKFNDLTYTEVGGTIETVDGDFTKHFVNGQTIVISQSDSNNGTFIINTVVAKTITLTTNLVADEGTADAFGSFLTTKDTEMYTSCRKIGSVRPSGGEINKSYWDAQV